MSEEGCFEKVCETSWNERGLFVDWGEVNDRQKEGWRVDVAAVMEALRHNS